MAGVGKIKKMSLDHLAVPTSEEVLTKVRACQKGHGASLKGLPLIKPEIT